MKKIAISLITLSYIALFGFTNASAGGIGVGLAGQYMTVEASGKETSGTTGSETDSSTVSASVDNTVITGSYYIEYALDNNLAIGFEGFPGSADVSDKVHTRTDTELSVTADKTQNSDSREFKAQAEIDSLSIMYLEFPLFSEMFYGRVGHASLDVNTLEVKSSNGGNYGNTSVDGFNYGVGAKFGGSGGLVTKVSYEATNFDSFSLTSSGNSVAAETNKISADLDTWSAKIAVGYQF